MHSKFATRSKSNQILSGGNCVHGYLLDATSSRSYRALGEERAEQFGPEAREEDEAGFGANWSAHGSDGRRSCGSTPAGATTEADVDADGALLV